MERNDRYTRNQWEMILDSESQRSYQEPRAPITIQWMLRPIAHCPAGG